MPTNLSNMLFSIPIGSVAARKSWSYHFGSGLSLIQLRIGSRARPRSAPPMGVTNRSWYDGLSKSASVPNSYIAEASAAYTNESNSPKPRSRARVEYAEPKDGCPMSVMPNESVSQCGFRTLCHHLVKMLFLASADQLDALSGRT